MTAHPTASLAFDGSGIDGSLFTEVTDFARDTRWLNGAVDLWTNAGLGVFAVLILVGWWNARRRDTRSMAIAAVAPVAVLAAFAVAELVKKLVVEVRPCYSLPHDYFVEACPGRTDYAFPSGHSTTAFAGVAALWLLDRRLSVIAAAFALLEGFTRVYVGAHYPHDVLGSALLALPVAYVTSRFLGRAAVPVVARLRSGTLRPVLTAAPAGGPGAWGTGYEGLANAGDQRQVAAVPSAGAGVRRPQARRTAAWDGSESLFYGAPFTVRERGATRAGREWIRRLRPSTTLAVHRTWPEGHTVVGTFVDPVTGIPAVAGRPRTGTPARPGADHSYVPQALPAGSRLKELILDDPVWLRTVDGTLYPAPAMDAPELSWGRRTGAGAGNLALLTGRLLDDGAAPAITYGRDYTNGEPELERTFRAEHRRGRRFSRRELERLRNGD